MTIEEARKKQKMSRKEISEWLEIPYRTLTNWENGERACPPYMEKLIEEKRKRKCFQAESDSPWGLGTDWYEHYCLRI